MIETRPVEDGDIEYVRANPFQEQVKDYPELAIPANTYTCVFGGEIVAVGGIKLLLDGVGEAWIITTKQSKKSGMFGFIACRTIKQKLDEMIDELKLRRCEAGVRADFLTGIRFVKLLGFTYECEKRNYFPDGTSAYFYVRLFDEHI